MVEITFALGAVFLGALLLGTVAMTRMSREWRESVTDIETESLLSRLNGPTGWSVLFFVFIALAVAVSVLGVSGATIPGGALVVVGGLFGFAIVVFILWGVYSAMRHRGLHKPAALAATSWAVGMLVLGIISAKLLGIV